MRKIITFNDIYFWLDAVDEMAQGCLGQIIEFIDDPKRSRIGYKAISGDIMYLKLDALSDENKAFYPELIQEFVDFFAVSENRIKLSNYLSTGEFPENFLKKLFLHTHQVGLGHFSEINHNLK